MKGGEELPGWAQVALRALMFFGGLMFIGLGIDLMPWSWSVPAWIGLPVTISICLAGFFLIVMAFASSQKKDAEDES